MLTSDGYTLDHRGNQIIITLPQTMETATSTLAPIFDRRKLTEKDELMILTLVKLITEVEDENR